MNASLSIERNFQSLKTTSVGQISLRSAIDAALVVDAFAGDFHLIVGQRGGKGIPVLILDCVPDSFLWRWRQPQSWLQPRDSELPSAQPSRLAGGGVAQAPVIIKTAISKKVFSWAVSSNCWLDRVGSIPKEKISQEQVAGPGPGLPTLLTIQTPKRH